MKILAVVILTDGYLNKTRPKWPYLNLTTSTVSECQHVFFAELCYQLFGRRPNRYTRSRKSGFNPGFQKVLISQFTLKTNEMEELVALTPVYKTTPNNMESKDEFLSSPQPNLQFLLKESKTLKLLAIRTFLDFDGSVVPNFKMKKKVDKKAGREYRYYQVCFDCEFNFAETNPVLVLEWKKLFESVGLTAHIKYDKRKWSGIDGLCVSKFDSVRKLAHLGPLTDVKISGKSTRFEGKTKKAVCANTCQMLKNVPTSRYFKEKSEAEAFRKRLSPLLYQVVEPHSPVV